MKVQRIFSVALLTLIIFPTESFSQDITSGLVGYWSFCGCSLKDQTGNGHDGTLMSGPTCVAGIMDQAYQFDGSNWIDVPYSDAFDINPDSTLTLAAWVKPARAGGYQALVVKGTDFWDYGLYIDISGAFMFGCNWPNHETFSTTIPQAGTWYHVVGVYNNHDWKLYINGKLEDELPNGSGVNQSTNGIGMGTKGVFLRDMYAGTIDEVRLYNRALTASDVMALFLWRESGTLSLSSNRDQLVGNNCTPVDTAIKFWTGGCGTPTSFSLDSVWLSGSSAFSIIANGNLPRQVSSLDSTIVEYTPTATAADSSQLHIRYDFGSGTLDTSIEIVGSLSSPLLSATVRLHREVGVSYFGSLDTLPLGVDINSSVNLDSLWPYLHDISATYSFDSSVVSFSGYLPPNGWVLNSFLNNRNSVDFSIHNQSSKSPSQPMDLGTALFLPAYPQLETSDVTLTNFILEIGNQSITPCVTNDEDQHWSVKVLVTDGVSEAENFTLQNSLSIYPNPAGDELFVQNSNELPVSITLYDAIGRAVLTANAMGASTTTLEMQELPSGSYMLVGHIGDNLITRRVSKIR